MTQTAHTEHHPPAWAERWSTQIEGVAVVSRQLVMAGMYVGAFVLMIWFVVGLITGFVSLDPFLGAGGLGLGAEALRRTSNNSKLPDLQDGNG